MIKPTMIKPMLLCLSLLAVLCLAILSTGRPGMAKEFSCADGQTLTRTARTALASAQKAAAGGDSAGARTTLETFIQNFPDQNHVYVTFTLAGLCLDAGNLERALAGYQKTVALCPAYAPAWQNLGKVSYDLGRFDLAAQAFDRTWELTGKENHILRFHAAVAYVSAKVPKKALAHMVFLCSGRAGEPRPQWVRLLTQLSIELKAHDKALAAVERLLAEPAPAPYLFRLAATLYLDMNQYKKAAQSLEAFALLKPLKRRERILLADLSNNLGLFARAAGHYQKALATKPCRPIYERLAAAWFEACERGNALAAAQKGLELYPKSHVLWRLKGWILYGDRAFKEASLAFAQTFCLNPKDAKSLFMHGLCAQKAGEYMTARVALEKAAAYKNYKSQALGLIRQMDAVASASENG